MLRVLVVDDSAFVRKAVRRILAATSDLTVVAEAATGKEALEQIARVRVDLVTLDVGLPDMSGLAVLRKLRALKPELPVVMLSACTQEGAAVTVEALTLGAADFIDKTRFGTLDLAQLGSELVFKVRAVAGQKPPTMKPEVASRPPELDLREVKLCLIGASTGGPAALQTVVQTASSTLPFPIVIAQHMPQAFTGAFAARLDALAKLSVSELVQGQKLEKGHAYVVPGGSHARILPSLGVELFSDPALGHHVPSVDALFSSGARAGLGRVLGVLLTGMGRDGAEGLAEIRRQGGLTVAQDESTSVVYGMPRAAKELGAVRHELPLPTICQLFRG